jgi:hypothetical protein
VIARYLAGSIGQLVERARAMIGQIPRDLPRNYDTLAEISRRQINEAIEDLRFLLEDPVFTEERFQPERLRKFKRVVSDLDFLENAAVAALKKAQKEDHRLNGFLERVCREINYPGVIPVVSTLSQAYFHIYPDLRLLCVPLVEGQFLLHLPDLYHELAHPLLVEPDDPILAPFQERFASCSGVCMEYVQGEQAKEERRNGPQRTRYVLEAWESSWAKYWLTEFFCDLFAVFCAGPAFAWSHLHLALKRGGDPYAMPEFRATMHPADDARMSVMLHGLDLMGLEEERNRIGPAWSSVLGTLGVRPEPEYAWCYPTWLLKRIAEEALQGTRGIGVRIYQRGDSATAGAEMNKAWEEFWSEPSQFPAWEKRAVERLLGSLAGEAASR